MSIPRGAQKNQMADSTLNALQFSMDHHERASGRPAAIKTSTCEGPWRMKEMRRRGPCSPGACELVGKVRVTSMRGRVQNPQSGSKPCSRGIRQEGIPCKDWRPGGSGRTCGLRGVRGRSFQAAESMSHPFLPLPSQIL